MSTIGVVAVVIATVWLAVLSLVALLCVRQIGLLTLRADRADAGPSLDGLPLGRPVPGVVRDALAGAPDPVHLLILSAGCLPCRELVDGLVTAALPSNLYVLMTGDAEAAAPIAEHLPEGLPVIGEPVASPALDALSLSTTPFAFTFADGVVKNKVGLRGATHFLTFLEGATGDAAPVVPLEPIQLEVTHVH